jgi:hypothetical protein
MRRVLSHQGICLSAREEAQNGVTPNLELAKGFQTDLRRTRLVAAEVGVKETDWGSVKGTA